MNANPALGVYGKLPGHADFIFRNLEPGFINAWDQWLQLYVSSTREQLGENWLDLYLTSPIWRFVFSSGVLDENAWAGIFLPSVDRVGRYFPFSVLLRLQRQQSPVNFLFSRQDWFQRIESVSLQALDGNLSIDELLDSVESDDAPTDAEPYEATSHLGVPGDFLIGTSTASDAANSCLPYLLESRLRVDYPSFCGWQSEGSEQVAPLFCFTQHLPGGSSLTAMIDGQWQQRNWKIPFNQALTQ